MKNILTFSDFMSINEKSITFGGKMYPKEGNIVIMCGGSGSGKSYVTKNVLGIDAKLLDIDHTRTLLTKLGIDTNWSKEFEAEYGHPLLGLEMSDSKNVHDIHDFTKKIRLDKVRYNNVFNAGGEGRKHKDNFIFDVTLKNYPKLKDIGDLAFLGGYESKNIHLVWVLNDPTIAMKQNMSRGRQLNKEQLMSTHIACANEIRKILELSEGADIINGDIWIYFGSDKTGDVRIMKSANGGSYVEDFCAVKVKESGKPLPAYEDIMNMDVTTEKDGVITKMTVREKINKYKPDEVIDF